MRTIAWRMDDGAGALPRADTSRRIAWSMMALGAVTGLVLGLWSFDGPVTVPGWLGDYGATARRLARLGHIACFGLGILNLFLVGEGARGGLSVRAGRWASWLMNFGNVGLPIVLFVAAVVPPVKYLLALPAMAVTIALVLMSVEAFRAGEGRRIP